MTSTTDRTGTADTTADRERGAAPATPRSGTAAPTAPADHAGLRERFAPLLE